jgi:pectate lyase
MLQSTGDLSKSTAQTTNAIATPQAAAASSCTAPGWASQNGGTTGGSGTVTVVTTFSQLNTAIKSSSVKLIEVRGTITIPSAGQIDFKDQSAKTLYGVSGARLLSNDQTKTGSGIIYMRRCSNVIIRNLVFEGPGAFDVDGEDNLTIDECTNIWVDHCEFRDAVDGNMDIKNASNFLTITYTKFDYQKPPKAGGSGGSNDHRFSDLIGSSDSHTADRGKLNITFDRCWWAQGCVERMPRVRFGKLHIVNNYFNSTVSNYCIGAGLEANILAEGNVFERVDEPIRFIANNFTAVTQRNNIFTSTTGNTAGSGTAFKPPYSLTVVSPATAKSSITGSGGAGATLSGNVCTSL